MRDSPSPWRGGARGGGRPGGRWSAENDVNRYRDMYRNANQRDFARQLRNQATDAERKLWTILRKRQIAGHKFRRQAAIEQYIVDFVCFETKLIIELDGGQHNKLEMRNYDQLRTECLESLGFNVLRFWKLGCNGGFGRRD